MTIQKNWCQSCYGLGCFWDYETKNTVDCEACHGRGVRPPRFLTLPIAILTGILAIEIIVYLVMVARGY